MKNETQKKIAVALSGGVDSAVVAKILKEEGHELVAFFLKLWSDPTCQIVGENRCCDYEALEDARRVAGQLNIPFYVLDATDEFKNEVVNYFIKEYEQVRTPNPCIICNEMIKFGLLLRKALAIGCDLLATGHYVRVEHRGGRSVALLAGIDNTKDQSYNLHRLGQEQLAHVVFPLGEMTKQEVRKLACEWNLPVQEKAESQEICFFGDRNYRDFLKRYLPAKYFKSGEIVDAQGNHIGRHEGLVNYTVGQRRGIDQQYYNKRAKEQEIKSALYVTGFDIDKNQLIVGRNSETYSNGMKIITLHWINPDIKSQMSNGISNIRVKIRSQAKAVGCTIQPGHEAADNGSLRVLFDEPQRAVTPGQSAVFYDGDEVIGGGVISQKLE